MVVRKISLILFLFVYTLSSLAAQQKDQGISITLENLFLRLRQNHPAGKKSEINDSIRSVIDSYSLSDSVFNHRFSNLRFLGQIVSTDSLVKLLTWNVLVEDGENMYFLNIIRRDPAGNISLIRISGKYRSESPSSDKIYTESDWYGALYYDIRPFVSGNSLKYLLLGIDYGNSFITRKIIDVLDFPRSGGAIFGHSCFITGSQTNSRIVFEYSAKAVMSLRFDSDRQVVFDHLSPFTPDMKENRQFYGPDFSFDAYRLEKGFWIYYPDIDIRNR